jgi:hypothetical protein
MQLGLRSLLVSVAISFQPNEQLMAQRPALDAPQAVVRAAFSAYESKHWSDFAALVHPDALTEFRKQHLVMAEGWEQRPRMAEMRDSTMPAAVAEYFDKMHDEMGRRFGNPVLREFARVKTLDELKALSPQEFLARFLEATSPEPNPKDPDYQPPVDKREVIGDVTESTSLVHVVYRVRTDVGRFGRTEQVEVLPVRRSAVGWRIMLNNELSFTGSMQSFGFEADSSGG